MLKVYKLYKLGLKPSQQGRQELPGLIFQSILAKTVHENYINWDFNPVRKGDTGAPWNDIMIVKF